MAAGPHRRSVTSRPLFRNRAEAGAHLANELSNRDWRGAVVVGVPHGGLPVAVEIARRLDLDLDVLAIRKLVAPAAPEVTLGAVAAGGARYVANDVARSLSIPRAYMRAAASAECERADLWQASLTRGRPLVTVQQRIVLLVDDGAVTGATLRAALRALRRLRARRVVVALPVAAQAACVMLEESADELVCPYMLQPFLAVGLYYEERAPATDQMAQASLAELDGWRAALRARPNQATW